MMFRILSFAWLILLVAQTPLRALVPPVLLQQPQSVTAVEGDAAQFNVSALGLGLRYQWYKNGAPISGATDSTLRLTSVTFSDEGSYEVVVSNLLGSIRPAAAQLTLYRAVQILSQPASQDAASGETVTFTVRATGAPGPYYQWTLNGENIPGANGSSLTLSHVNPADGGTYQALVFNGQQVVNSEKAVLVVDAPYLPFRDAIAARGEIFGAAGQGRGENSTATHEPNEPYGGGVDAHKSVWLKWIAPASGYVTFTTIGSSFDTLLAGYEVSQGNFQLVDSDDDGSDYHTSLLQFNVTAGQEYAVSVDGEDGSSGEILLTWNLAAGRKMPVFTSQPQGLTLNLGQLLSSLNLGIEYDGRYTVQWYRNGEPIPNLLGPVLNLASELGLPVGIYYAKVTTDNNDVFYSDDAEIQINTEGLKAASRNKRSQAASLGIRPLAGVSGLSSRLRILDISGSAGYSGTQIFHTAPGRDPDEPNHCGVVGGASYWLAYTAPSSGILTLRTDGSDFDTILAVYTDSGRGSGYSSLLSVGCDNNSGADGRDSRVSVNVNGGQRYYIVVDGVYGAYGTAYLNYSLNQRPTISGLSSFTMAQDTHSGWRGFTVSDNETAASDLQLFGSSSNPNLISSSGIYFGGSGSQRTILVRPNVGQSGQATISVVVRDADGGSSAATFVVTVTAGNSAPVAANDYITRSSRYSSQYIYIPSLLNNDRDPDGDSITFYTYSSTGDNGGRISRSGDYLIYTPGSYSSDSFTYYISDGRSYGAARVYLQ